MSFPRCLQRIPERIIEKAVKGMLTRGRLGNRLFHHLKASAGIPQCMLGSMLRFLSHNQAL